MNIISTVLDLRPSLYKKLKREFLSGDKKHNLITLRIPTFDGLKVFCTMILLCFLFIILRVDRGIYSFGTPCIYSLAKLQINTRLSFGYDLNKLSLDTQIKPLWLWCFCGTCSCGSNCTLNFFRLNRLWTVKTSQCCFVCLFVCMVRWGWCFSAFGAICTCFLHLKVEVGIKPVLIGEEVDWF